MAYQARSPPILHTTSVISTALTPPIEYQSTSTRLLKVAYDKIQSNNSEERGTIFFYSKA